MEFPSKTADSFSGNRFFVEVSARNIYTKWVSSRKSQVAPQEIKSVSMFGLETSTETEFAQETSAGIGFFQQNRRWFQRRSNLCRGFRPKRLHKAVFPKKPQVAFWEIEFVSTFRPKTLAEIGFRRETSTQNGFSLEALKRTVLRHRVRALGNLRPDGAASESSWPEEVALQQRLDLQQRGARRSAGAAGGLGSFNLRGRCDSGGFVVRDCAVTKVLAAGGMGCSLCKGFRPEGERCHGV